MANKDAAFGLRPARMMNGSAFMNQQNRYRIASGATTAIFQGDLVETLTAGTIGLKPQAKPMLLWVCSTAAVIPTQPRKRKLFQTSTLAQLQLQILKHL